MHSVYSPLFMALIGVAALLRLGCPVSRADFFCICVYMDIVWTTILHSCCQLPFHTSHIMNLFKQKSFSLGVFLSHLLLFYPILAILILQQSCDIIHCYTLFPKAASIPFRMETGGGTEHCDWHSGQCFLPPIILEVLHQYLRAKISPMTILHMCTMIYSWFWSVL